MQFLVRRLSMKTIDCDREGILPANPFCIDLRTTLSMQAKIPTKRKGGFAEICGEERVSSSPQISANPPFLFVETALAIKRWNRPAASLVSTLSDRKSAFPFRAFVSHRTDIS
jgi:hypothetical protein